MTEQDFTAAILAGLAYTGMTRRMLADRLGINYNTLNMKLRREKHFTVPELVAADHAVKWSEHWRT